MTLVPSLLRAIVAVGGQSLVLQAGEKPYVSAANGAIDLAGGGMTAEAIADVISQILPAESQQILTQFGAVQHDLADVPEFPGEQFRVVATNEGTTLGVEIRRLQFDATVASEATVAPPVPRRRQSDRRDDLQRVDHTAAVAARVPDLAPLLPPVADAPVSARRTDEIHSLERMLQAAVAEGASALYLTAGLKPWIRVDDDLRVLEGVTQLTTAQIESMLTRAPEGGLSVDAGTRDWFWEFAELGRMRCTSFRDHRGPGLVLRSVPATPATSRQLGLSRDVESLAARSEGLIVAAAARAGGAHALIAALVDVINRTRRVHVICIEREVSAMHESEASLVSQREAGRSLDRVLDYAKAALRENPDVLVLDTVLNVDLLSLALDAAHSGHLVICAARGNSVARVIADLVGMNPAAERQRAQIALSRALAGVVVETGPANGTGARDLLVNSPESAYLIAEGRFAGLGHPDRRR